MALLEPDTARIGYPPGQPAEDRFPEALVSGTPRPQQLYFRPMESKESRAPDTGQWGSVGTCSSSGNEFRGAGRPRGG
jgi:hypothetical protein